MHETFSNIDLMLDYITYLHKFKRIEFVTTNFSDYDPLRYKLITNRNGEITLTPGN